MSDSRMRALWVTNVAAPYRIPVWESLAKDFALRVGLLESSARLAENHRNRGDDWLARSVQGAKVVEYRTIRVTRGEDSHFGLYLPDAAADVARADVVLLGGWDSPAYWQMMVQARLSNKPLVGFYESTLASQSRTKGPVAAARRRFFHTLDRVVVPGPAARDAVLDMGVDASRIHVGFNAVDSEVFRNAPSAASHQGHRYLFIGQFIGRKNIGAIVDAFTQIAEPEDRLTLVGRGELREKVEADIRAAGLQEQVVFVDYMPNNELPTLMAENDTLVLASKVEVWGLVVNEALAAGMQAVVTSNCGVAASVKGMPGVVLAAADASDLPAKLAQARQQWHGRILDPPILGFSPERFAGVFGEAFRGAIEDRGGRHE